MINSASELDQLLNLDTDIDQVSSPVACARHISRQISDVEKT